MDFSQESVARVSADPVAAAIAKSATDLALERKVRVSGWALLAERVWLRLWWVFAVAGAFIAVSLAGLWPLLAPVVHLALLGVFALAGLAALAHAGMVRPPDRDEALRRLERTSGQPHRPASSYEDTLSAASSTAETRALWQAHRARLAAMLAKLRPGPPQPLTHRFDPMALRALGVLGVLLMLGLAGDAAKDRLASAFRLGPRGLAGDARLDAWVTPPAYTAKPPILLADGQRPGVSLARENGERFEIPVHSLLVMRATGTGGGELSVDFLPDGAKESLTIRSEPIKGLEGVAELKTEITQSGVMTVPGQPAPWAFSVIPDHPPKISLLKEPEPTSRGSMKLNYRVEDDYGVVGAEARFERLPEAAEDEKTAWARTEILRGPRQPLERPPRYALRLPSVGATSAGKPGDAMTYLELGAHPWAGLRVRMTLEAKDAAGQTGRSEPREMILPARRFSNPLARAVVEQRRKLVADARYRPYVGKALEALMIEPDGFMDTQTYLGLRTSTYRLQRDRTRAGLKSVIEQLWQVALRLEDGALSDAERRLKDAQDRLSKALDEGASEAELERLMKELREAMADYVQQLAKQNENTPDQAQEDRETQQLGQNDLERMLKQMEQAAKNGSREQAQQMLSEMRDLMDRLQASKNGDKAGREAQRQMQKKMDELGDMIGQQQKLMDDTFSEMKRESDQGDQGKKGQKGRQQGGQGNKGQDGKGQAQNKGEKGSTPQRGQKGDEKGAGQGTEGSDQADGSTSGQGLRDRQKALAEQLDKLKGELRRAGAGQSKEMDTAEESMRDAENSLEEGNLDDATGQQGEALESMRKGAQKLQQEMAKNGRNKFGENGETPRDPLGRPQKSQGPDAGASVKVPGEIDVQRAREILEELRKRSAEQTRPTGELDYLERLLKRF